MVAAESKAHVELSFLAVGAFPGESSLAHHPSDRLVQLVGACIVAVAVEDVGHDIVGLQEVETMTEDLGDDSGKGVPGTDTVYETWNNAVVALPVP